MEESTTDTGLTVWKWPKGEPTGSEHYWLKEAFADYAHRAWAGWMQYLFAQSRVNNDGSVTIPQALAERWARQVRTSYADLSEKEKESDRKEADRMMAIMLEYGCKALCSTRGESEGLSR